LNYDQLALVETLSIGAHAVQRGKVVADEWVVVVGVGPIGLATAQFAQAAGARLIVMDINPARLDFIRGLGVQHTINPREKDAVRTIAQLTDGELAHVVMDATGNAACMAQSLTFAGHTGRVVWVGLTTQTVTIEDPLFHRRELTLYSTRNSAGDFPRIIEMIERGEIETIPWITHRLALKDVPERFEELLDPKAGVVKAVVEI
jgi:threonine dehydrogenase-like Zn-dependent dehydrogenase